MNKPRLIDANELVKYMQTQKPIITLDDIARFPTAYDIDAVIERLESLKEHEQEQWAHATVWGIEQSIKIVKGGAE